MFPVTETDRGVLRTIVYFDLFDFPLTDWEIHQYYIGAEPTTFLQIKNAINNLPSLLDQKQGFYFLKNKLHLVDTRKERYLLADNKYQIALKNAKLLKKLPFVRAIFISNRLAYSNPQLNSDLDFIIITANNRLWTARFFTTLIMKLLNRRPKPNNQKNKVCLSFYVTQKNLNLEAYANKDDITFCFWLKQFSPIYDPHNLYNNFYNQNLWANKHFANSQKTFNSERRTITSNSLSQKILEFILPKFTEKLLQWVQWKIMPKKLKQASQEKNTNVVINNQVLKLHLNDRRQYYNELWQAQCQKIIPGFDVKGFFSAIIKHL